MTLEICVESVEAAIAAEAAGADRLELCDNLNIGGITPSRPVLLHCLKNIRIPIYLIIRPRGGDFMYTKEEIWEMVSCIEKYKKDGCSGVVFGVLNTELSIDVATTKLLIKVAEGMQVTFHKAFDSCKNLPDSLQQLIDIGCNNVLTSGGKETAEKGKDTLAELVEMAKTYINVMPGGSVRNANLAKLVQHTKATHFHSAATTYNKKEDLDLVSFSNEVKKMKDVLLTSALI